MFESIYTIILAILGLGILILIHELGHFFMAKKVGMRVETFSIGFGPAIFSKVINQTRFKIGCIPFGGYIKVAGMDEDKGIDPYKVKDGYFGKKPYQRILVSFMGPFSNFLLAFLFCLILFLMGGKEHNFSEFTHHIGWVDPESDIYKKGLRVGDEISRFQEKKYEGIKDFLYSAGLKDATVTLEGYSQDPLKKEKNYFHIETKTYELKNAPLAGIYTTGISGPAEVLIYKDQTNDLSSLFDLKKTEILSNDRILFADGEFIYSLKQLDALINQSTAVLTVQNGKNTFFVKIPRVKVEDLKLSLADREEIDDLRHTSFPQTPIEKLFFIPYYFNEEGKVESSLSFIDKKREESFKNFGRTPFKESLNKGDKIIAVDGIAVKSSLDILKLLQSRRVLLVVERNPIVVNSKDADKALQISFEKIDSLFRGNKDNQYILLKPVEVKSLEMVQLNAEQKLFLQKKYGFSNESFTTLKDHFFIDFPYPFYDQRIIYNPNPFIQVKEMMEQMVKVFSSLIQGKVKFQWLSGPVGIVKIMQKSWQSGGKDVLTWMAFISINLGFINLIPLPALDGGHILFSIVEMIRRKPLSLKMMEWLTMAFFILLFLGLILLTYQDVIHLIKGIF